MAAVEKTAEAASLPGVLSTTLTPVGMSPHTVVSVVLRTLGKLAASAVFSTAAISDTLADWMEATSLKSIGMTWRSTRSTRLYIFVVNKYNEMRNEIKMKLSE